MTINLARYCANETDPREYLRAPFRLGTWVYATNGHVCVRVASAMAPDITTAPDGAPAADKLFAAALEAPGEFVTMPDIEAPLECTYCEGAGLVAALRCTHCDGDGTFTHDGIKYDCKICLDTSNGAPTGWVQQDAKAGDEGYTSKVCDFCDGIGHFQAAHALGGINFNHAYLWWMAQLPQVRVKLPATNEKAAVFIGDGFQALVMPRRD